MDNQKLAIERLVKTQSEHDGLVAVIVAGERYGALPEELYPQVIKSRAWERIQLPITSTPKV